MKISVLYGTETGNAEMLADDIQSALSDEHEIDCINLADVDPGALSSETFHVIVCSTYGDGELPASAKPFAEELAKTGNGLSGIQFAVFGLGDAEYAETFTHGSLKLADLLKSCGATQVGERMTHDASGDCLPEDVAVPWISEILNQVPLHSKEM
ncbi:nitric oxide synthase [Roseibium polysiphoniae]|uniref:Nitric oxide synthase n=1 Tax=Roseibium polysiphoniae TaxID=2571221 RepID=A0A944CGJ5_9HYPH|nr:flavodoxin domain-containing protein [Roseibium polysiphoniae]MBS8262770.1 nitric oxide synthase [Roseibium polysiphoniae]